MRSPCRSMAGSTQLDPERRSTGGREDRFEQRDRGDHGGKVGLSILRSRRIQCCGVTNVLTAKILVLVCIDIHQGRACRSGATRPTCLRIANERDDDRDCGFGAMSPFVTSEISLFKESVFASFCEAITPATAARARTRLRRRKTTSR